MELSKLYEVYGQYLVEFEILQSKIQDVKQKIAQELNKPKKEE